MRIVAINGRFLTQPKTGVQRYAYEILSALAAVPQDRYRFVCIVPENSLYTLPDKIETVRDKLLSGNGAAWQQLRLPVVAAKIKADLLWSPCNIGPAITSMPHVVNLYDAAVFQNKGWFDIKFELYYKLFFKLLGKSAKIVVTCSDFSKNELALYGVAPKTKTRVIYGGANPDFRRVDSAGIISGKYVLTLGSRDPRKNIASLVEAWRGLSAQVKNGRLLVIAGDGAKTFRKEVFKSLPPDIRFTGYLNDDVLPALYSKADAFVYPSFYEGFGFPPLEAMGCGCPVVCSDAASLPEVCGDAACYVKPDSSADIARGIRAVLEDPAFAAGLAVKGFENVKRFSWEKAAIKMLGVLDEI